MNDWAGKKSLWSASQIDGDEKNMADTSRWYQRLLMIVDICVMYSI